MKSKFAIILILTIVVSGFVDNEPPKMVTITGHAIDYSSLQPGVGLEFFLITDHENMFGKAKYNSAQKITTDSNGYFEIHGYLGNPDRSFELMFLNSASVTYINPDDADTVHLGAVPIFKYDNELEITKTDSTFECTTWVEKSTGLTISEVVERVQAPDLNNMEVDIDTIYIGTSPKNSGQPHCWHSYKTMRLVQDLAKQ